MGEKRNSYRVRFGNLNEWDHSQDEGVNGRIILKAILKKDNARRVYGLNGSDSGYGKVVLCCEEYKASVNCGKCPDNFRAS